MPKAYSVSVENIPERNWQAKLKRFCRSALIVQK